MAELEQSRSEQATPFKLREARRRGSVPRSLEVSAVLAILGGLAVMVLWGGVLVREQLRFHAAILDQAGRVVMEPGPLMTWLSDIIVRLVNASIPLWGVLAPLAILGNLLQTGPVFTLDPLKPDINRLNPIEGLKKLLSIRMLFEFGKNLLKVIAFSWAGYAILAALLPQFAPVAQLSRLVYPALLLQSAAGVVWKLAAVALFIAALDLLFTRWQYQDRLKMSRREVRDELKQHEGDPRLRLRLRELRRELVKQSQSVRRVPEADVLITNPTHLAVAILYRREDMAAPQVIAKGAGEMALHFRTLARQHRIPVMENPTLARALYAKVEVERSIPEKFYPQVARILVWAYALRDGRSERGSHGVA